MRGVVSILAVIALCAGPAAYCAPLSPAASAERAQQYLRGEGVVQDIEKAYFWAWRARLGGNELGLHLTEILRAQTTPEISNAVKESLMATLEAEAEAGDVEAFLNIARVHLAFAVPETRALDLATVAAWSGLAAAYGVDHGAALRDAAFAELPRAAVLDAQAQAQNLFAEWCQRLDEATRLPSCDW